MANRQHLALIRQGVDVWNNWRKENPGLVPDFIEANLSEANLYRANLRGASLYQANLGGADLILAHLEETNLACTNLHGADVRGAYLDGAVLTMADCREANLRGAHLRRAHLSGTDLRGADLTAAHLNEATLSADFRGSTLSGADLRMARLNGANLSGVSLSGVRLSYATLVGTNFSKANLDGCFIYGIAAWGVNVEGASQSNLVITPPNEPTITVDNLEVAQFVYLLLHNEKIRGVIDTIGKKAVLILGRFTEERKAVLDALREELRKRDLLPILVDFDKPSSRNITETVSALAHMARFVIADITDAKSIPQELQRIVPALPSVPVQPVILSSQDEYGMFNDFRDYHWVLPPHRYDDLANLLAVLEEKVILPAVRKAEEIAERRKALEEELTKR